MHIVHGGLTLQHYRSSGVRRLLLLPDERQGTKSGSQDPEDVTCKPDRQVNSHARHG